jgi:hypothetical protein
MKKQNWILLGRKNAEKMYWLLKKGKSEEALQILDEHYKISTKYKDWYKKS